MIHLLISCTSLGSILTCDGLDCHAIPVATAAAPPTPSTPIQWLPLGDSITWGCGTDAAPRGGADCCKDCGGYRVPLAWALTQSGHNVTTMGTLTTGPSDVVPARWINHEGHPGWRFDEIDGILDKSLATSATPPNLVTIHLGTNDCGQHDPIVEIQARSACMIFFTIFVYTRYPILANVRNPSSAGTSGTSWNTLPTPLSKTHSFLVLFTTRLSQ